MSNVQNILDKFAQLEWERIKSISFPYPKIDKDSCLKEWECLCSKKVSIKKHSPLIKRFHRSIYKAKKENRPSSVKFWELIQKDFNKFQRFYRNRLLHSDWSKSKENEKYIKIGFLPDYVYVQGMTTSGSAPTPSYFKPMLAKYIIKKYLNSYDTIFDPFSGYSGRALGALACNKNYIGQDISSTQVEESKNIIEYLKKHNNIKNSCTFKVADSMLTRGKHDCLFTCSPYSNLENWGLGIESYSCDKWITKCLNKYKCKRYVFVTDDKITKYKKYIKETLINKSHWGTNYEYVVVIDI